MIKQLIVVFLLLTSKAYTQNETRSYLGHTVDGNHLEVQTSEGSYRIQFYTSQIIETTFIPAGESYNAKSHAVVLAPGKAIPMLSEDKSALEYGTEGIKMRIQFSPFQISYSYKDKIVLSEKEGYVKKDSTEAIRFSIEETEALYGGGERVLGMNRRGNRLQLYNRAHYGYGDRSELMNFCIPMVLSSKLYAVHFDNAPIGYLDLDSKKDNTLEYETISGRKTYQVIVGDSWEELVGNYTLLTGRQPLPPRWAFGNFSSRFGYHSQKETTAVIDKFRAEKIPVDAIVLDLYWFGKTVQGTMGNLEFLKDSFPNPKKMITDLKQKNVKTILVTEPFILTTSKRWNEVVEKGIVASDSLGKPYTYDFYFGNTGLVDIFKPESRKWFWNIYKELNTMGVSGWWGDLGEPEVHPSYVTHATGTADEVHNIYGHNWAQVVFEGYRKDFPEQRPFILMRSGYSGSQRFGMIPWSGDVGRSWGGLQAQPEIAMQMGMQGLGYMHSDLGGFAGDNLDNELYVRWLQYGVFQPIFRPHAQESVPPEPVFREPKTKALAKKAIELRYQLLPYNYSGAFENNQKGTPLMRPVFFEDNSDTALAISDAYLWGANLLAAPITKPGITVREVYFPKGSNWIDFFSGKKHYGGQRQWVTVAPDHIPVFVRSGSFVPMIKTIQSTEEYTLKSFNLHFYFDENKNQSTYDLYNDDGVTPNAFEKGKYETLRFTGTYSKEDKTLTVIAATHNGNQYLPEEKRINLIVHQLKSKPKKITIGDKKVKKFTWNPKTQVLEVVLKASQGAATQVTIQLAE